jgi:hypothetical protein
MNYGTTSHSIELARQIGRERVPETRRPVRRRASMIRPGSERSGDISGRSEE